MNGTCSGTHIIYQWALSLPLSLCTPFKSLNLYFVVFEKPRAHRLSRKSASDLRHKRGSRVMAVLTAISGCLNQHQPLIR